MSKEVPPDPPDLMPCPGGCGNRVHASAAECPQCGYRSELSRVEDLLASLSTVSSILVGFGLAALVQLATGEQKEQGEKVLACTVGCWGVASLLLLAVMIGAEILRRRDTSGGRMKPSFREDDYLWKQTEWLLRAFALSLACTAAGVVLLGFFFSLVHGIVSLVALAVGAFLIWKTFPK